MKATCPFLFLFLCSLKLFSQTFEWVREGSGIGQDAGQRVITDRDGNIYVTGYFSGEAFFSGTQYTGNGIFDIYLARYSPSGELLWLRSAGGVQNDAGYGIAIDSRGFIYVTGYFTATVTFPKTDSNPVYLNSAGSNDIFLAKYDQDGNLQWVKRAGSAGEDRAQNIAIDRLDNIYITGYFSQRCYFDSKTAITQGSTDVFIAKYDTLGNCGWVHTLGGTGLDKAFGIAVDTSGYAYITGFFYYDAFLSNSSDTLRGDGLSSDIFVCKYSPAGDLARAERVGGPYNDAAFGIAIGKDKSIFLTGYFLEEIDFGNCHLQNYRYNDMFIVKYDSTFKCEWANREGGNKLDMGLDIVLDEYGNAYVTGMYDSVAYFGGRRVVSADYYDIFVCKYNGKGVLLWMQTAGGLGGDFTKSLCVRNDGAIYLTGYYKLTCSFGSIKASLSEEADIFLAKMSQPVGIRDEDPRKAVASLLVFPNPCAGVFFIESEEWMTSRVDIFVLDITGKIILQRFISAADGRRIPIRLETAPGIYFIRMETRRGVVSERLAVF